MSDDDLPDQKKRFYSAGWVGGLFLAFFNLLAAIPGFAFMQWVMLILCIPIYFMIARNAAQNRYQSQIEEADPIENVSSTGMGSTMIAITLSVVGIIIEEMLRNAQDGSSLSVLCWLIPANIVLGFLFGAISTQMVIKSHQMDDNS
jgi:cation transport ATPase